MMAGNLKTPALLPVTGFSADCLYSIFIFTEFCYVRLVFNPVKIAQGGRPIRIEIGQKQYEFLLIISAMVI